MNAPAALGLEPNQLSSAWKGDLGSHGGLLKPWYSKAMKPSCPSVSCLFHPVSVAGLLFHLKQLCLISPRNPL